MQQFTVATAPGVCETNPALRLEIELAEMQKSGGDIGAQMLAGDSLGDWTTTQRSREAGWRCLTDAVATVLSRLGSTASVAELKRIYPPAYGL